MDSKKLAWADIDGTRYWAAPGGMKIITLLVDDMDLWYAEDVPYCTYKVENDAVTDLSDGDMTVKFGYLCLNDDGQVTVIYRVATGYIAQAKK